jgi:hypothetical protein
MEQGLSSTDQGIFLAKQGISALSQADAKGHVIHGYCRPVVRIDSSQPPAHP